MRIFCNTFFSYAKIICIFPLLLLLTTSTCFSQDYLWAKNIPSTSSSGRSIVVDNIGNSYITGRFSGSGDFDPGSGTATLSATFINENTFLAKYDSDGNYIWAKCLNGGNNYGYGIAVDNNGYIYISGSYEGTVDFDPSASSTNKTSLGGQDIFFAKYDNNGNFLWVKSIGGAYYDWAYSIIIDNNGSLLIAGGFMSSNVDFDPGPGSASLTSIASSDIFFAKYDGNGDYLWAKRIAYSGNNSCKGIGINSINDVYITGYFNSTTDFDPGVNLENLTATSSSNTFIAKYNASGIYLWAKSVASTGTTDEGSSLSVSSDGGVCITGNFEGTAYITTNQGVVSLNSVGGKDILYAKYDNIGNCLWAKSIGGTADDFGKSITVDVGGSIYIAGSFRNTVDFDPGTGTNYLTSAGGGEIFLAKFDTLGNYLSAKSIESANTNYCYSITIDSSGRIYITGTFYEAADFDLGPGTAILSSGGDNIFFAKYRQLTEITTQPSNATVCEGSNTILNIEASGAPPFSYQWKKNGVDIIGATSSDYPIIDATIADDGIYTCEIIDLYNSIIISNNAIIKVIDLFLDVSNDTSICNGQSAQLHASGGSNYTLESGTLSYLWNPVTGLNPSNAATTIANPTVTTEYTVQIADVLGCTETDTVTVTIGNVFQNEQICLVTVDTSSWKNKVLWEKTVGVGTEYYLIYKETGTNSYSQIGNVAASQPAEYVDLFSQPEVHGDKYKITALDTCGNESGLDSCYYHKTVNLTIAAFGSTMGLNWDDYIDESGNYVPFRYYIYRGSSPTNMALYDSVSGSFNSYNDNNVLTVYYYMIGVKKSPPCNVNGSEMSFSNKKDNSTFVGIVEHNGFNLEAISIYPNPFKETTTINFYNPSNNEFTLFLTDASGRKVRKAENITGNEIIIERKDLQSGIYFIELKGVGKLYRGRFVVE